MNLKSENTQLVSSFAKKTMVAVILAVSVIITQTGCGNKEVSRTEFCLDTMCTITVYGMPEDEAEDIIEAAFDQIERYEGLMSRTIEGSDVYNINNSGGRPVKVSDDTAEVISQGIYMGEISGGKFDITIGGVTELWDFTGEDPAVPDSSAVSEAVKHVDYSKLDLDGNTVTLQDPEARIDLGGIAKGYIADKISKLLSERGVESAIVNLGGNIVAIGEKPDGSMWNIGIERPYSDTTEVIGSVEVRDATLVTSGIYERKFVQDGVLYHHVLDPDTGYPAETDLESVTITAENGNSALCDGLSTVCLILGSENAQKLIDDLQEQYRDEMLEAAFIDKNNNIVQTDGMKIKLAE